MRSKSSKVAAPPTPKYTSNPGPKYTSNPRPKYSSKNPVVPVAPPPGTAYPGSIGGPLPGSAFQKPPGVVPQPVPLPQGPQTMPMPQQQPNMVPLPGRGSISPGAMNQLAGALQPQALQNSISPIGPQPSPEQLANFNNLRQQFLAGNPPQPLPPTMGSPGGAIQSLNGNGQNALNVANPLNSGTKWGG